MPLARILDNHAQVALLIKGHPVHENLWQRNAVWPTGAAILGYHLISYTYQKPEGVKSYIPLQSSTNLLTTMAFGTLPGWMATG